MGIAEASGRGSSQSGERKGSSSCPCGGSLAAPSPRTRSMLAFFDYKHRAKAIQFMNLVLSPWNCTEGMEGDYWGCPFAPRLVLLHSSLQGHHTFMVMAAECSQATSFSSSCWQGLATASRGHFNLLIASAHGTSGFGWHRGDLSSLLQAPCRAAWPAQLDPGPVNNHVSVCWGRLDSWEL